MQKNLFAHERERELKSTLIDFLRSSHFRGRPSLIAELISGQNPSRRKNPVTIFCYKITCKLSHEMNLKQYMSVNAASRAAL